MLDRPRIAGRWKGKSKLGHQSRIRASPVCQSYDAGLTPSLVTVVASQVGRCWIEQLRVRSLWEYGSGRYPYKRRGIPWRSPRRRARP